MRLQERAADRRRPSSFASAFWRVLCYVIDRKWPTAEIEVPSEPVRVAPDSAEVFTSARPPARDVILASGLVGKSACCDRVAVGLDAHAFAAAVKRARHAANAVRRMGQDWPGRAARVVDNAELLAGSRRAGTLLPARAGVQVARRFAGTRLHGAQRRKLGGSALPRAEGSALSPF